MSESKENTWLPNLVGGVSIWKLAVDLNEPKFFDGRLLVPETEGSESLPVTVRWDLTGLTPLKEAQSKWPEEVGASVRDFQSALDRVAKVFSTPNSGFDKYKEAFTVPALDAEGAANYFYSADKKKLYVINWGASPRAMGGKAEYVFGYQDWGKVFDHSAALSSAPHLAVANVTGENPVIPAEDKKKKDDEKKAEEKKDENERAWWIWPLFALIAIALILLALFLMRGCEDEKNAPSDAAADALADGASEAGADAAGDATADAAGEGGSDAAADALGDGGDAGADAMADAAGDGGGDAGKDGGKDGGLAFDDDDDDDLPGGGGGGGGGGGSSGGGGKVIVKTYPGGGTGPTAGARTTVHRRHYSEDAVAWRITSGTEKVARSEERGHRYDVWLAPGKTFEGVKVEWQDKAGKWHAH